MIDHLLADHMTLLAGGIALAIALIILLRWTGQKVVVSEARLSLKGDGTFDYFVAGTDAHQPVLSRIAGRSGNLGEERVAELVPAATSEGTLSGIAVRVEGAHVGEIAARDLHLFNEILLGRSARSDAVVIEDRISGALVVRLDLIWPPRLA